MIACINQILSPIEILLKKYRKYIGWCILFLSFLSFGYLFDRTSVKASGGNAILLLWVILWIPIFSRVFWLKIAQAIMPLRKELGILMGTLAFVHSSRYILSNFDYTLTTWFWIQDWFLSFLAFWFFALIFTIPLTLTSNTWSMKIMGKYWKYLHRTVYAIIIFTVTHVVLLNLYREFEWGIILFLIAYFIFKVLEWKNISFLRKKTLKTYPKWQKWICVPCGHIYDPLIGDTDSGIDPGTEFTDIPDSWKCPDCGVRKSDFILYTEGQHEEFHDGMIVGKTYLNPMTLELIIELAKSLESQPGQFMVFLWEDTLGVFTRQYSIVEHSGNRYTFTIKLSEKSRGSDFLRSVSVGAAICIKGIYGNFLLQENQNPKIFIATGTGIAPIYSMIQSLIGTGKEKKNHPKISLYFSVSTEGELFYVEKLRALPNIDLHIHVSRESIAGFEEWRVDIDMISTSPETEWYLCGNPKMVAEVKEKLKTRGYVKVYSEVF